MKLDFQLSIIVKFESSLKIHNQSSVAFVHVPLYLKLETSSPFIGEVE